MQLSFWQPFGEHRPGLTLVGPTGKMAVIYCPFIAVAVRPLPGIKQYEPVAIEDVNVATNGRLVYISQQKAYYHSSFQIAIDL